MPYTLHNYKSRMRHVLDNLVAGVLGIASAAVFAQMLMQGELTKSIVLFYQKEHLDNPNVYTANVTEMFIIEMEFLKISLHLISGVLIIFTSYLLKRCMQPRSDLRDVLRTQLEDENRVEKNENRVEKNEIEKTIDERVDVVYNIYRTRRETCIFILVSIGLILWDVGYLIIGYEKPHWGKLNGVSMGMIAFGGGIFLWGSFILFMHRIGEIKGTTSWAQRAMLALFASGPPLFIMLLFPHVQQLAYETEVLGDKYQFYLAYQSVGSYMLPFLAFVVFAGFVDVCTYGCRMPAEYTENFETLINDFSDDLKRPLRRLRNEDRPSRRRTNQGGYQNSANEVDSEKKNKKIGYTATPIRWYISYLAFLSSKVFFGAVFFGAALLYSNWIHHIGGPGSFTISNTNGTGFDTVTPGLESTVTRNSMLLMAGGVFISRFLFVFAVDFPRLRSDQNVQKVDGDFEEPSHVGWTMTIRFLAHLFAIGGIVGWHLRTFDTTMTYVGDIYGIAFLIGLGNGGIFLDSFISVLLYFKMDSLPMFESSLDDVRLMVMMLLMVPTIITLSRFSTGAFGALGQTGDRYIDYRHYTLILACFIGAATFFDLLSFIAHPTVNGTCGMSKAANDERWRRAQKVKEGVRMSREEAWQDFSGGITDVKHSGWRTGERVVKGAFDVVTVPFNSEDSGSEDEDESVNNGTTTRREQRSYRN